jgi:hypothetical protein
MKQAQNLNKRGKKNEEKRNGIGFSLRFILIL